MCVYTYRYMYIEYSGRTDLRIATAQRGPWRLTEVNDILRLGYVTFWIACFGRIINGYLRFSGSRANIPITGRDFQARGAPRWKPMARHRSCDRWSKSDDPGRNTGPIGRNFDYFRNVCDLTRRIRRVVHRSSLNRDPLTRSLSRWAEIGRHSRVPGSDKALE